MARERNLSLDNSMQTKLWPGTTPLLRLLLLEFRVILKDRVYVVEVLLYVHRNRRLIRDGRPERPPRLSYSSWTLGFMLTLCRFKLQYWSCDSLKTLLSSVNLVSKHASHGFKCDHMYVILPFKMIWTDLPFSHCGIFSKRVSIF